MVAARTVDEYRHLLTSFTDNVALDSNFANLPATPGNKELILRITPVIKVRGSSPPGNKDRSSSYLRITADIKVTVLKDVHDRPNSLPP